MPELHAVAARLLAITELVTLNLAQVMSILKISVKEVGEHGYKGPFWSLKPKNKNHVLVN